MEGGRRVDWEGREGRADKRINFKACKTYNWIDELDVHSSPSLQLCDLLFIFL